MVTVKVTAKAIDVWVKLDSIMKFGSVAGFIIVK
jgi:hypothetical protein